MSYYLFFAQPQNFSAVVNLERLEKNFFTAFFVTENGNSFFFLLEA